MKLQKRWYLIVGFLVLALALMGCNRGPAGMQRDKFTEHMLSGMDKMVKKLNLTAPQQEKYQELRKKVENDLAKTIEDRKKLFSDLQAELDRQTPNMSAMSETVKVKIKSMSELFETHLDYFTEFYNVLDENQKAQIIQAMREKMKKHK